MLSYFLVIKGTVKFSQSQNLRMMLPNFQTNKIFQSSYIHYRYSRDQIISSEPYVENNFTTSMHQEGTELAQWVKAFVGKHDNLSMIPGKHIQQERMNPTSYPLTSTYVLWYVCMCTHICTCTYTHTYIHTNE